MRLLLQMSVTVICLFMSGLAVAGQKVVFNVQNFQYYGSTGKEECKQKCIALDEDPDKYIRQGWKLIKTENGASNFVIKLKKSTASEAGQVDPGEGCKCIGDRYVFQK